MTSERPAVPSTGQRSTVMERLDYYHRMVSTIILSKQDPRSGLIPASVAITSHGNYTDAWVRDNVYSIMAVFGLALAYRRLDDNQGRAYELEHAVVKLMRGLLYAMMQQAHKVEQFKSKQSPLHALHAKYSTRTGMTVVADHEWGHLQLDATSLFLLALAEMTASGLRIIYTMDEVDFVQNLVFYVERSYRTPDYGIWERGNKMNHGMPELNSSSIGMAVAALQAINGINLFGSQGGPSSTIHVLPDEITRNYTTLHSSLPRESLSKETDAAILSVIGFPAFAVHDLNLLEETKSNILKKLRGRYGCKRFLRDGHQAVLEDKRRLHYEPHELEIFENIECEWPLFFAYLVLNGIFSGEPIDEYREALKSCLVDSGTVASPDITSTLDDPSLTVSSPASEVTLPSLTSLPPGLPLVPELYIVEKENIQAEKKNPHSQKRIANENVPLVWAQSLYILSELLLEKLISPHEIDPLGRHLLPSYRGNQKLDTVVQIALVAENAELQSKLATFGLDVQTVNEVFPITISSPSSLRDAYAALGANSKLGLSGRPKRPVGTLGTCRMYRVQGHLYAFTPHFMDKEEFYMTRDNEYLISVIETELKFIRNHWWYPGRPTMTILLTNEMMGSLQVGVVEKQQDNPFSELDTASSGELSIDNPFMSQARRSLLTFMISLRSGSCAGVRVRLGRLRELVATSCVESLDFLTAKLEQGYLMKTRRETWQELLGAQKTPGRQTDRLAFGTNDKKSPRFSVSLTPLMTSPLTKPVISPAAHNNRELDLVKNLMISNHKPGMSPPLEYKLRMTEQRLPCPADVNYRQVSHNMIGDLGNTGPSLIGVLQLHPGDANRLEEAINLLFSTDNLYEQIDLLYYIYSCRGGHFLVSHAGMEMTVSALLEEVYEKASRHRYWGIVRQAAGLLRKVVNSLTINLTDLLIRQKQVTIGSGEKEFTITAPLSPDTFSELIFKHCTSDICEAPLMQEILTHLGNFIRTEPSWFDGILRVRIQFIIEAMQQEIARVRSCTKDQAKSFMIQLSPFEMKSFLGLVLSAKEKTFEACTIRANVQASHESRPPSLDVSVQSAGYNDGNFCKMDVGGVVSSGSRGLSVVIVNHRSGTIMETTNFDTHISNEESEDFSRLIESCVDGTFVIVAAKDDCFEQLTEAAKLACESIGSRYIREVGYRDSWCIIGRKGAVIGTVAEVHAKSKMGPTDLLSVKLEFSSASPMQTIRDTTIIAEDVKYQLPNGGIFLRRRQIDGALQRTPKNFYPRVHKILTRSSRGISTNDETLARNPTVSETTPEEVNFALRVDSLLDSFTNPAERQIAVECLLAISEMEEQSSDNRIGNKGPIKLPEILELCYQIFWSDWISSGHFAALRAGSTDNPSPRGTLSEEKHPFAEYRVEALQLFFDLRQDGADGTLSFLTKAICRVEGVNMTVKK